MFKSGVNRFMRETAAVLLVFLLYGCTTSYYGYSKDAWNGMSEGERSSIKSEYELVLESRNKQGHQDVIDARMQSVIDRGAEGPRR